MIYTRDKDRILFSKKLESLGIGSILENIRNMNWSDYVYNGPCELKNAEGDDDNDDSLNVFEKVTIQATLNENPYVIFGGAVYVLYKQVYPDDKRFMDPTGDVDVQINIPKIVSINDKKDVITLNKYYMSTFKEDNTLNELTLHYMKWCLDHIYDLFEVDDDLEEYEYENENVIFTKTKGNKLYFSIVQEPNMIKAQVECKVKGMDKPDHMLEFVLLSNSDDFDTWDMDTNKKFKKKIQMFNGFPIQKLDDLIEDNVKAMEARFELRNDPTTKHKLYNHIGRVRYLNYIYPKINEPMSDAIKRLLYFLWTNHMKIYSYNYEPTMEHREFMMSMMGHFYENLTNSNDTFIVIRYKGTRRKIKSISDVELKTMYKPLIEGRRSIYKTRHTRRSRPKSKYSASKNSRPKSKSSQKNSQPKSKSSTSKKVSSNKK